jgi:Ribonuclease G/E
LVELEREIKSPGLYDGLGVAKEPGDRAVTEFVPGRWWYKTRYLSPSGELKGEYYNINTPIEIYPDRIRYVDLELDLVRLPGGEMRLIDEAELDRALAKGWGERAAGRPSSGGGPGPREGARAPSLIN